MNRHTGFTLVEMMIAVAIMAILMGIAAPSFQTFIQNTQIRTAAESLQSGLNLARTEALRRNARVTLWMVSDLSSSCALSATGTSWVVSFNDPTNKCHIAASDTTAPGLIQSRAGNDGSSAVSVNATNAGSTASSCITFNGFGGVENTCGTDPSPIAIVQFTSASGTSGTREIDVRVTPGGAVRACYPDVANTNPAGC